MGLYLKSPCHLSGFWRQFYSTLHDAIMFWGKCCVCSTGTVPTRGRGWGGGSHTRATEELCSSLSAKQGDAFNCVRLSIPASRACPHSAEPPPQALCFPLGSKKTRWYLGAFLTLFMEPLPSGSIWQLSRRESFPVTSFSM